MEAGLDTGVVKGAVRVFKVGADIGQRYYRYDGRSACCWASCSDPSIVLYLHREHQCVRRSRTRVRPSARLLAPLRVEASVVYSYLEERRTLSHLVCTKLARLTLIASKVLLI